MVTVLIAKLPGVEQVSSCKKPPELVDLMHTPTSDDSDDNK